jgi:hypothetical protein
MCFEGLAITRALHDRYHAARRNPWNEVECGDHYARSMASYGVFLAACGYEYHGPKRHLGFAPKLSPENFRAPFTTAEGWGTVSQTIAGGKQHLEVSVKSGLLRLRSFGLDIERTNLARSATAKANGRRIKLSQNAVDQHLTIQFASELLIKAGQKLELEIA